MDEFLDAFFRAVMHEWVPWALAGAIIAYAGLEYLRLYGGIRPIRRSVRSACLRLAPIHDASDLAHHYETLNETFASDPWIGHAWREFSETLLLPDGQNSRVRNTAQPSAYVNAANLIQRRINARYVQAVPNILVGLGLLFTFIGLIAALFFAAKGVASDSVQDAQIALRQLLSAATFKFVTSVAGLAASIAFSIAKKRLLYTFSRDVEALCQALEARLDFVSPIAVADQSHRELEAQTRELQKFNTDLAFSIAEAMDKRLSASLSRAMAPMAAALDKMAGRFGEMNQEALERMIARFSETLEGAAGRQIDALIDGMKDVQGGLHSLVLDVNRINGELSQTMAESADQLRSTVAEAASAIGSQLAEAGNALESRIGSGADALQTKLQGAAAAIEATLGGAATSFGREVAAAVENVAATLAPIGDRLSQLTGTLGDLDSHLGRHREALTALHRELDGTVSGVHAVIERLERAAQPISTAAHAVERSGERLAAAAETAERSQSAATALAGSLQAATASVTDAWSSYRTHFEGLDTALTKVFGEINVGLAAYQDKVAEFVIRIDKDMERAVKLLGGAVQELNLSVEGLEDVLEKNVRPNSAASDMRAAE